MKILLSGSIIALLLLTGCDPKETTISKEKATVKAKSSTVQPSQKKQTPSNHNNNVSLSPLEEGQKLYRNCISCHGKNGEKKALNQSDIINDWDEEKLYQVLKGYKEGTYGRNMKKLMSTQVKHLNDTQLKIIAHYITTLKP